MKQENFKRKFRTEYRHTPRVATLHSLFNIAEQFGLNIEKDSQDVVDAFMKVLDIIGSQERSPWGVETSNVKESSVDIDGESYELFSSYSYLGLSHNEQIRRAAVERSALYGTGAHGSRMLLGNLDIHTELESRIASFMNRTDSLIFSSGYLANIGCLSGLIDSKDVVFIDQLSHMSMYQGAQLSGARIVVFRHNSVVSLKEVHNEVFGSGFTGKAYLLSDSVFSMDGDIFDLPAFNQFCKEHKITMIVDEAHGVGVIGKSGRGIEEYFEMTGEIDLIIGTFSKALPSSGGFVVGKNDVISFLKYGFATTNAFSGPISPYHCSAAIEALNVIEEKQELFSRLSNNCEYLSSRLRKEGFNIGSSNTPIIPVIFGEEKLAYAFWIYLLNKGYFTSLVSAPAVPMGKARLRLTATSLQTSDGIDKFVETLCEAKSYLM